MVYYSRVIQDERTDSGKDNGRTKELIRDGTFQQKYAANPERDFTRQSKLGFPEIIKFGIKNFSDFFCQQGLIFF